MLVSVGDKLGPYEIFALIGKGGMGEVYRARDPRLNRDVAIKVSAAQFSERFEREAKAIAALNHPNICQIYDVGPNYLVMEYIEGESPKGPMPLDGALHIARQIANALEAAHDKGITHRDLKPGNIKIKPDGTVKVLDFGLAKVTAAPSASGENSPTLTMGMTQAGMILGTASYMAPEQARGKESVDKRADIWAFGVVLYELITGKRMFTGEDVGEVLAKVIRDEPDLSDVPSQLTPLLKRCLEKDPKKRLRDIGDMDLLLANAPAPALSRTTSRLGRVALIAAGVLAVVAASLGVGLYRATRPIEQPLKPLVRLNVDLGSEVSIGLGSLAGLDASLSPDGTRLAYASRERLFIRRLDQPKANELADTEGAFGPFFSPDGQSVAFFTNGKLKKISVEGGAAVVLCDQSLPGGGSWGEDGNIIAALNNGALSRISSAGGTPPTPITKLAQGEITHRWPQILPGGKAVLFTSSATGNAWDGASIEVVSLADRVRKTLHKGGTYGRYIPSSNGRDGYLIYVNQGTLFAVPFDPEALAVRGTPSPVLEQINYSSALGFAQFTFSQKGTLVYRSGSAEGSRLTIQWLNSAGKMQPLLAKPDAYQSARLSPDGQRLAISTTDLSVYELQRGTMTRLTIGGSLGGNSVPALWSPDGRYLIFRKSGEGLFWTRSDGAGTPQLLVQGTPAIWAYSFKPDGKRLAFSERTAGTGNDLWTMPIESDGSGLHGGKPEMFLATQFNESRPAFSPDGRWLAFASDEGGATQIFVRAFPGSPSRSGGQWQVSDTGGSVPKWSWNTRELFFRTPDNRIAVAAYTVRGDSFVADKPRMWSERPLANAFNNGSNYDLAPDGKRAVVFMPAETPEAQKAQSEVIFLRSDASTCFSYGHLIV